MTVEKKQITYLSAPLMIWYDVTTVCDFNCKHCYSASGKRSPDELNTVEAKHLIDQVAAKGTFYIYFLGGEPFMRPDFIELVEHAKKVGLAVMINTNGWYLDDEVASRLAACGTDEIRFSLDGASPEIHDDFRGKLGSHARVLAGIDRTTSQGISTSATFTMTQKNYTEIKAAAELLIDHGVTSIQFGQLSAVGRGRDNADLTLNADQTKWVREEIGNLRERCLPKINIYSVDGTYDKPCTRCVHDGKAFPDFMGCQAGRTCCNVTPNGNVVPCLLYRAPIAGNVRETSFGEIWDNSELFSKFRSVRENFECQKCKYNTVCARECPLSASQTGVAGENRIKSVENVWGSVDEVKSLCHISYSTT